MKSNLNVDRLSVTNIFAYYHNLVFAKWIISTALQPQLKRTYTNEKIFFPRRFLDSIHDNAGFRGHPAISGKLI